MVKNNIPVPLIGSGQNYYQMGVISGHITGEIVTVAGGMEGRIID